MFKGIVKVLKIFNPAGLAARYFLRLVEILEVFMVGMDFDRLRGPKEEGASHLKSKDNGC